MQTDQTIITHAAQHHDAAVNRRVVVSSGAKPYGSRRLRLITSPFGGRVHRT
jgi:hypothetical protein